MEKPYHYRTRRINGKVVRKYIGRMSQPAVEFLARAQRLTEAERQQAAEKRKQQKLQAQRIEASMKHLTDTCRFWSGLDLCYAISSRRAQQSQARALAGQVRPSIPPSELKANMMTQTALKKLLKAAQNGDEAALAELRKVRRNAPQVLACIVDIVQVARAQLLDAMAGHSPTNHELVIAKVDETTCNLRDHYGHDLLSKLYAEIAAVAYMDAIHCAAESGNPCHTMAARERRSALADRAFKRFCIAVQFLEQRQPPQVPPAETRPVKSRVTKARPAKTQATRTQVTKTRPAKEQATKTRPAKTRPAKTRPAKARATKARPAKAQASSPPAKRRKPTAERA